MGEYRQKSKMKLSSLISIASAYDHYATTEAPSFDGTCGGTITKSETIVSPGFYGREKYYANLHCVWNIELGDDVIGFNIKNKSFRVEPDSTCDYDYVDANGKETAYCGYGIPFDNRKRRHADEQKGNKKENGKFTGAQHYNVEDGGFPENLFIEGGSAVITFHTDRSDQKRGFELEIGKPTRFQRISYHAERIFNGVSDNKWATRYESRLSKVLQQLEDSKNWDGSSCYDDNVPKSSEDEGNEVTFSMEDEFCTLNGQVNAAINSYARNYACEGRGKVFRQIIRSARKVKNFFNQKYQC